MNYTVKPGDSLYSISRRYNISLEQIRRLNDLSTNNIYPGQVLALQRESNNVQNHKHTVRAGESLYSVARQYQLSVSQLKHLNPLVSSNLRVGQELRISRPESAPSQEGTKPFYHKVVPGDSLSLIAQKYQLTVSHLVRLNGLLSNNLKLGQMLKIQPIGESDRNLPEFYQVDAGDSLYSISRTFNLSVAELMELNQLSSSNLNIGQRLRVRAPDRPDSKEDHHPETRIHVIKAGDSLYQISREYGVDIGLIRSSNQLNSDILHIGQQLLIPSAKSPDSSPVKEKIHVVKAGESLYRIAREYRMSAESLMRVNKLRHTQVEIGQVLKIPVQKPFADPDSDTESEFDLPSEQDKPEVQNPSSTSIREALKIFKLHSLNGEAVFAGGLNNAIGRNRVNRPEDLLKVQERLVQLNMLNRNHNESPDQLHKRYGTGAITTNYIPLTISAIERFQEHFKVRFWIEHSSRVAMMKTSSFTPGVVVPGDISDKLLREYTEYEISFPHPHNAKKEVKLKFHDFPRSYHTVYYKGVSFAGVSKPEIPLRVFKRLGADETLAQALSYVSQHEGKFDAINSYDRAFFSFGFIQFAGNGGGLVPLLASIKSKAPKVFAEYFLKFGLDVETQADNSALLSPQLVLTLAEARGGRFEFRGQEAEQILRQDKVLHGVFMRAGHYLPIITLQIDAALENYVKPALNIRLNLVVGALRLNNVPVSEYICSVMGKTLLIDLTVNRWVNVTRKVFQEAIEKVAKADKLYSKSALKKIDERKVIYQIIQDARRAGDNLMVYRASNIYRSTLDWQKPR